ncbi:MAG: HAMP domain-containing histidine kinase, partial [Proteobacteria bacterium]|nr:HAMP domain-containing histidine kinase [Pseudomonadota bacterium]
HELRTPLHHINSYSNFGLKRINQPKQKLQNYFNQIDLSCSRMTNLVNNLLDLSQHETDKVNYRKKSCNIAYVFNNVKSDYFKQLNEKELRLKIQRTDIVLNFDFTKIRQVVSHIVGNAVKFAERSSTIEILFRDEECNFFASIANRGIPIPSDELESIFDPFIQSSKTKTGAGGTGLGLSICRNIIEDHQGKIWADENANGASITFYLPKEVSPSPSRQSKEPNELSPEVAIPENA